MDSSLIYSAREANGQSQFPNAPGLRLPQLSANDSVSATGLVLVDIKTTDANATAEQIRLRGGTVMSALPQYNAVRANVPIAVLDAIAAIPAVTSVRPADIGHEPDRSAGVL